MGPSTGPLPGLGEVGHSPRATSGSAGTLNWGPMWLGSQSTCHPNAPLHPLMAPNSPTPQGDPQCPIMLPILLLVPEYLYSLPAPQYTPDTPLTPTAPTPPTTPKRPQCLLMPPISLLVVNCHHFASDHLHAVKMFIFYHCHFQISSLCN